MPVFARFHSKHGTGKLHKKVDPTSIKKYQNILPEQLLQLWQEHGWQSYAQGFLRTVDPDDYQTTIQDWSWLVSSKAVLFLITGMGDFFAWDNFEAYYVGVNYGWKKELTGNIRILFDFSLQRDDYLEEGLNSDVYKKALPKLGAPKVDECYAFVPAMALGGSGEANTLQKVKLREHLAFLAQLHQPS
jgi:hypothetical protein